MAKKRQHDFARVQLRPGRIIGKRGNITSTKFKSRKIIMPKEKAIKMKSEITLMDYINRIKTSGSDKDKSKHLYDLNKLIHRQPDTLNAHLLLIFNSVFDHVKDPNDNVREGALKVVTSLMELSNDLHLHHCADIISRHITAIMKNPNQRIASVSLKLLDSMLEHHPALICHNLNILDDLLPNYRKHYTRKNPTNEREKLHYSENDEINALGHISTFLKNMLLLKDKNDLAKNENDKVVHMDEKVTSVVLYAGGGLQPVDIEQAYAAEFNPPVDPFHELEKLTPPINALLKYIPIYFCQVVNRESNADDNAFRNEPISDLCVIIQLLCNVAELAENIGYSNGAEEIAAFLKEKVFSAHKKRFPFELYSAMTDAPRQSVAVLNASLCYLQMKFLSSDDSYDDDGKLIKRYLKKFFSAERLIAPDVRYQCVPYFIKMIQLCEYKTDVPNVIPVLLKNLVNLLKTTRGNPSNKKMLIKFLLDMSLLPAYKFWIETPPMKLWYEWLINHLKDTTKLDKETMQMICKIAKLRHSSFIELLDFNILKPLLTKRNNDLRETAIFLLHNMDIDNELLKNVYDVICLDSFPKKFAIGLIRMLNVRFNQYPASKKPYVDYIEFLLNIAIDVSSFSKSRMIDVEANNYTKAVQLIQHGHPFCIVPSLHWRDHSQLFEVCLHYLRNLPIAPVSVMFMKVVKELLRTSTLIPMHSALALLKLDMPELSEKYHRLLMRNLNFSCLLTVSVLTQTSMMMTDTNNEWYKWTVHELMNSMSLTTNSAIRILELLEQGNFGRDQPDGLVVYHILRVLKVFVERNVLDYENADVLELVIQVISSLVEEQCTDKTIKLQPLFSQMYNFFIKYFCE